MKKFPSQYSVREIFSPDIISGLKLERLIASKEAEKTNIVYDFMVFVLKSNPSVEYSAFNISEKFKEKFHREENKRLWLAIELLLKRSDNTKSKNVKELILTF